MNFSLFSEAATEVALLLFDRVSAIEPAQIIRLDPFQNKTFHFWHVFVRGCRPGICYALRVDGPADPAAGYRFNPNKVLIGPYARGICRHLWKRADAVGPGDNLATSMRCAVVDPAGYDWEGDSPLRRPFHESIIYELHVGGFTRSPSAGVRQPGTFAGLIEKIPYLQELGITAVELLPVCEFDDSVVAIGPGGAPLRNYWGYSTIGFFSPHSSYCVARDGVSHMNEFRDLVKALHRAGIEVILDVVFNHTDEGNELGPTHSFRGIDNQTFYLLDRKNPAVYMNYSGAGNTVNANHPLTQKFIVDCLRHWVQQMHVDGFRFDEGSVLARGEDGAVLVHPPVIWQIELEDAFADTKLIAEAWDAAGLYQVGHFPGDRWAEWNARYRDDVRKFVRGDPDDPDAVARRADAARRRRDPPDAGREQQRVQPGQRHELARLDDDRREPRPAALRAAHDRVPESASGADAAAFLPRRDERARRSHITWHGTTLGAPGFDDPLGRALACTIAGFLGDAGLHVMMNMFWEPLEFEVPVYPGRAWHVAVDTFAPSPNDAGEHAERAPLGGSACAVQGRSIVVLVGTGS